MHRMAIYTTILLIHCFVLATTISESAAALAPDQGPGGPILVIASTANPFSRYYAEILRTEGFNAFSVTDISQVSAATLANYDMVILGEMSLTAAQVTMFSDWVSLGGNLIAMRPDKKLAGLLGLTDANSTLSEGYLLVNTSAGLGAGIVGETMQFHGTADRYTLSGATSIAMLYTNAVNATTNPAVTLRSFGLGEAATFTFDLARSVTLTRQGNPAWAGQERDQIAPIRSDDLFYPDWVNLSKVHIPQADEQQRLLANLILNMNFFLKPLPRFWYFPKGKKAIIIMTHDDHGEGAISKFEYLKANSPANCSLVDWACLRATNYGYTTNPLTNSTASAYDAMGFEVALHVNTLCDNWTPLSLESFYAAQLNSFRAKYPSLPPPSTNRTHCVVWSDYSTQPQVELNHGIRFDTTYYYWPPGWVGNRPGLFTGSGLPMRFAKQDGTLIDVYQATTQMTDESGQTYPFTVDMLLNRALGTEGYYGAFTANMHGGVDLGGIQAIVSSALARGVPIISARQMLNWLDARNNSSFGTLAWNGNTLNFSIVVDPAANNLQAMLPTASLKGPLLSMTRDGSSVIFTKQTIKGIEYAFFPAVPGTYQALYSGGQDTTPPNTSITIGPTGTITVNNATFNWTGSDNVTAPANLLYAYRLDPIEPVFSAFASTTTKSYSNLANGNYTFYAKARDQAGNEDPTPASQTFTVNVALSNPTITLSFDGQLRDRVGQGETRLNPDGQMDGVFTVTLNVGSGNRTVTRLQLTNIPGGVWNTQAPDGFWSLGVAGALDASLLNAANDSVNFAVTEGSSFKIFASDYQNRMFLTGTIFTLTATFAGGSTATANATIPTTVDTTPPETSVTSGPTGAISVNSATFNWTGSDNVTAPANLLYAYRLDPIEPSFSAFASTTTKSYSNLANGNYTFYVKARDQAGNEDSTPASQTFTVNVGSSVTFVDITTADFAAGTIDANTYISQTADGEVILAPTVGAEFSSAGLPAGWFSTPWATGGTSTANGGAFNVDGAITGTNALFGPGRSLEFVATFTGATYQHVGFGTDFNSPPWVIFSTASGGALYARTSTNFTITQLPGDWLGTPHRYRIDWNLSNTVFSIDGVQVATHPFTLTQNMRPLISDAAVGGGVIVDWLRMGPYVPSGTFLSRVFDGGGALNWDIVTWTSDTPAGTSLIVSVRQGNTAIPDASWSPFVALSGPGTAIGGTSRYLQYRVQLSTTDLSQTPALRDITIKSK
jgi:uncharacterized protein (DUF2345 family)